MKNRRKSGQLHLNHKYSPHRETVSWNVPDTLASDIERIRGVFPHVFAEGKIDFERLQTILAGSVDKSPDRFTFSWAGKKNAVQILQLQTRATLVPAKEESLDFDRTQNVFIEGDNLEVLKLLSKPYFGRVKLIYVDSPYNTGNDFVYPDNYVDPLDTYLRITEQKDSEGNLLTSNPETSGRYHSAWLSMLYPRLFQARQLLRDDGVIFVSIDNNELANLRLLMNEVFGEENFVGLIVVQSNPRGRQLEKFIATSHEYLVVFAKDIQEAVLYGAPLTDEQRDEYREEDPQGKNYRLLGLRKRGAFSRRSDRPNLHYPLYVNPQTREISTEKKASLVEVIPKLSDGTDGVWRWSKQKVDRDKGKLEARKVSRRDEWDVFERDYLDDHGEEKTTMYKSLWLDKSMNYEFGKEAVKGLFGDAVFDAPKPVELLKRILRMASSEDDIVLDFFAGSCTTAHAMLELNREDGGTRRFIMVQLQEPTPEGSIARKMGYTSIAAIGEDRIRRVLTKMRKVKQGKLSGPEKPEDLGFKVFKLVESNHKPWRGVGDRTPEEYAEEMKGHIDSLVRGWKEENVIYEIALKEGFGLNSKIELMKEYKVNKIWRVTDADSSLSFLICLDDTIDPSVVKKLDVSKETLFVCRESAINDTVAANLALQCRLKTT